ncbi:hypothetical protein Rsub_12100 [Raphidocelis subcapitata]|uniref:Uncharacterized protein n=1 Tax=Raphidocelis subcapitata TaxID=307507 RepID=A0A2V0PIB0_9CHLO|nr:hypothetical protein Rsub_12100 [Raphidocelis subcapitata]|eukprot:GBF99319.1 hypothetical protein Rsub_12100 [Raphidocelis subcapitata]
MGEEAAASTTAAEGEELDDSFSGLAGGDGLMTVAGFGSLLSERSARSTFPDLGNFRPARLRGWRRVFAHTADVFFARGIARPSTREISSLSCEPRPRAELVVALFEVPFSPLAVQAFIQREHEFRFVAVRPTALDGARQERLAVLCAANTDEEYRARRCPPDEWARRWGRYGIDRVWRDDVLPCRVYLRHCVLAAKGFCPEAYESFLDGTFLSDRRTTVREYLRRHPDIMEELPPPELLERYSG